MYVGLMMLGQQKYTCTAKPLVPELSAFGVEMAIEKLKRHKVLIKSQQNWLRQGVEQFTMRSINLLIFGIRRNCLRSGRGRSLYLSVRRVIKQIVVIIGANYVQNFIQHPAVKVNSICRGNYWDRHCGFRRNSSTTDHVFIIHQILEKKWASSIYRLQESLWFS